MLNAISPKYLKLGGVLDVASKPPVLRVHGTKDMIVSDSSPLDVAVLGLAGYIPGYPGARQVPTAAHGKADKSLEYASKGSTYERVFIEGSGHTPFIEKPEEFAKKLVDFIY